MDKSEDRGFRILFVIDSLFTGGAEFSTLMLASWLKLKMNWSVRILCLKEMSPSYQASNFGLAENVVTMKGTSFLKRISELNQHVKAFGPQIIHSVLLNANLISRFSKLFNRKPVYVESLVNRTYDQSRFRDRNVNNLVLFVYQMVDAVTQRMGADRFHAVTRDIALHYNEKTFTNLRKVTVVHRGREENQLIRDKGAVKARRRELKLDESAVVFLNIGRHEYQKGQLFLLKAFKDFLDAYTEPSLLLIVGREGNETETLRNFIRENGMEKQALLLGHREDTQRLLAAADVFVLPSVFEGIGGVLIEAEAASLPIICSDLEGLKEVVEPGANALVVSPGNVHGLALRMLEFAGNEDTRKKMGEKSVTIFNERFRIEVVHASMVSFYEQALQR